MPDPSLSYRRTPYQVDYGSCVQTSASLVIRSERPLPEPLQSNFSPHTWRLDSAHHVDSRDLRHHIDWLLDQLEPTLEQVDNPDEIALQVDCAWWSRHGHGGPTLWPEQFARLSRLDVTCNLEFYTDVHTIAESLALEPTDTLVKGEISPLSPKRLRLNPVSLWRLTSRDQLDSLNLCHHLEWLLDRLEPVAPALLGLQKEPGLAMPISCMHWARPIQPDPSFSPALMERLANLNLELELDVYFLRESPSK